MPRELKDAPETIHDSQGLTIPGLFEARVAMTPGATAYLLHDGSVWQPVSWCAVSKRVGCVRDALALTGLKRGDRVGLYLANGVDWISADVAAMSEGLVTVPLYTRDSATNIRYLIEHAGVRLCMTDTTERWNELVASGGQPQTVDYIWVLEETGPRPLKSSGCNAGSLDRADANRTAEVQKARARAIRRENLATIVYTSGTTGRPKGVMLSHGAILSNAQSSADVSEVRRSDLFLSILPLAHGFERTLGCYLPMMCGATVAFSRSTALLKEDLAAIRPTILLAVPRLFERIAQAIRSEARKRPFARFLLANTERIGWTRHLAAYEKYSTLGLFAQIFWFLFGQRISRRVLGVFGGKLRIVLSGGAPLSQETFRFMLAMNVPLIEGYGLTEAGPVVTGSTLKGRRLGSVGRPLPGVEVRLGDRGELLVRTPSSMLGYWRNQEATDRTIDPEGWLHTGDVAELREGHVFIKGRIKDILVLSTGENVNPVPAESALLSDPLVDQVCVLGDGHSRCSAIIVVNPNEWATFIKANGQMLSDPNAPELRRALLKHLEGRMEALPPFAWIRDVYIELKPWSQESGLITPTLKPKRRKIADRYQTVLSRLPANTRL